MPDGATYRDHLKQAARRGARPPELEAPELPPGAEILLDIWMEIAAGRSGGGFRADHLSWQDLDAWCRFSGVKLNGWEAKTLLAMDRAAIAAQNTEK